MAKKHIAGAAAVMLAATLAGCTTAGGGGGSDEQSGEITVLTNRTDLVDTVFADYVTEFNKEYPDIAVTFEAITDYDNEVTTRLSTSDYGDVLLIPTSVTKDQYSQFFEPFGAVEDLSKTYRFIDEASFDGQAYGLSPFGNANGIVYNKRVWEEAGITELPTSPEEFLADLELIKTNTNAIPYYTNYKDGWPLAQWQGNRGGISGDPEATQKMSATDDPWTEGNDQFVIDSLIYDIVAGGLSEPDPLTTAWEGSKGLLATGEVASVALGSWAIVQFQKAAEDAGASPDDIGYMPFPYQTDGKFHSVIGGDSKNAINVNSDNKGAARTWIEWFTTKSGFAEQNGALPATVDGENPEVLSAFTELGVELFELTPPPAEEATLDQDLANESEIDLYGPIYRQKMIDVARGAADGDKRSYFADLNERWAAARVELGQ